MQTKAKVTVVQQTEERLKTYLFPERSSPVTGSPLKRICAPQWV